VITIIPRLPLVPDTNPTTVAEAIVKLLTSRTLAEKLGKNAINHISRMFSIERMKKGYMKLLRNEVPNNVSFINQQPGVFHEESYH
jgi:glycosyltransferase involved in cell wall biosynthesis